MSTIKRICVLVSIIFLFLTPAWAESDSSELEANSTPRRYSISINPLFGILYGKSEEIVYKFPGKDKYLSQLLWDIKPLVYLGFAADFSPRDPFQRHGIIAAGLLRFGLPLKAGSMEDRDWKYPNNENLTNYSKHDAYYHNAILMDLSAGYSWRLTNYLALGAYGEFSFMHYSWMAEDGYYQYLSLPEDLNGNTLPGDQVWSDSIPKMYNYGPGIRYIQNWLIFAPGISLKGRINRLFSLEGNFSYSPLIYCVDRDDHLVRNLIFWDYTSFGHYINGGGRFTFSPLKNLDLCFALSYRYITRTRGKNYAEATKNSYADLPIGEVRLISNDGAGVGYSVLNIELAAKIRVY